MLAVVCWLPIPLVKQVSGFLTTTANIVFLYYGRVVVVVFSYALTECGGDIRTISQWYALISQCSHPKCTDDVNSVFCDVF